MSGKKNYQKLLKEVSKYRRLEIEVLLTRYVEIFDYDEDPSPPEIEFADLTSLLRAVVSISQSSSATTSLTQKEIDLVFRLYICLRKDKRQQLLACQSLCEVSLINCHADFMVPNYALNETKHLRFIANFLVPNSKSDADKDTLCEKLIECLDLSAINSRQKAECMILLTRILTSGSRPVSVEACISALNHLTEWIKNTDVTQTDKQQFFGDTNIRGERKSTKLVTELSGGSCQERFTILNVAKFFSQSQLLHIEVIYLFRSWLTCLHDFSTENPESEIINRTLTAAQGEIVSYCSRLLDQVERNLKSLPHRDLMISCLLEIIDLLIVICKVNDSYVRTFYMRCSLLFDKCNAGAFPPVLAVKLMAFLVNHAEGMGKDSSLFFASVFGDLLGRKYSDSDFSHELIWYIINNANMLCLDKGLTIRYFPNIAKVFVWNPRAYLPQFIQIFPMFMEDRSLLEVLHYILDIPCTAATMELAKSLGSGGAARQIWENQTNQRYLRFLMRPESGKGDTLSQMDRIFNVLNCYQLEIRVTYNYDVSLRLLKSYFDIVFVDISEVRVRDIVPLILERSILLYGPNEFRQSTCKLLSQSLLHILQTYPNLVFDFFDEIREFLSRSDNISKARDVYLCLLYAVGRGAGYAPERSQRTDQLARLYESLECMLYELLGAGDSLDFQLLDTFWCAFAAALAKLAVVVQDLIPRCSLALSKIQQICQKAGDLQDENGLRQRVNELVQLLTRANVGAGILCPETQSCNLENEDSFTPVLKTIGALAESVLAEKSKSTLLN